MRLISVAIGSTIVQRSTLVLLAALALGTILLVRRARGGTRLVGALRDATRFVRPKYLLLALLVVVIWLAHVALPTEVPDRLLDVSWNAALPRAAAQDLRAGVDYIFTYGPFAVLATNAYYAPLFDFRLVACECVLKLGLVLLLARLGLRMSTADRVLFFGVLLFPTAIDSFFYLCILAVGVLLLDRERLASVGTVLGLAAVATLSLVKFSFLPPAILCVVVVAVLASTGVSRASGPAIAGTFALLLLLFWWVGGQELRDLPTWFRRSLDVSSGYGEACASSSPQGTRIPAFVLIVLFAFQAWRGFRARPRSLPQRAAALLALPILWVSFKAGFVRAADHTPMFFGFTLVAAFVFAVGGARDRIGTICRAACVVVSVIGLTASAQGAFTWMDRFRYTAQLIRTNARCLADPGRQREICERNLADARSRNALPRVRAVVGDRPIDMVSYRQGVLFLNDLRWTPRPVFQSYLTFTPALMEVNAQFLRSERASEFILFCPETIDDHLLSMDDALALQVIARDYELVLAENNYLLLRRNPRGRPERAPEVQIEKEVAFGEDFDLSGLQGTCHVVKIDIAPSLRGRAMTFLEKAPALFARVELDSGATRTVRIVPGMLRAGVLIDPYLETDRDWARWYTASAIHRPVRMRIERPVSPSMYGDRIRVQVLRADELTPRTRPELAAEAMFSQFKTFPADATTSAPVTSAVMRRQDVLLVAAPSELSFDVAPGRHTLSGRYGILPSDWQPGGADFSVLLRSPGREDVVVFHVHVDPTRRELDQRLKYLKVEFEAPGPARLLLRTDPGPGNEPPSRATVWTAVAID